MDLKKKTDIFVEGSIEQDGGLELNLELDLSVGDSDGSSILEELGLELNLDSDGETGVDLLELNTENGDRLDLQEIDLNDDFEEVQSINIQTDLERFTKILRRISEYEGTSKLNNTRSTLRKFSEQFIKIISEAVEEVNFEISPKQSTAIKNSTKELKAYLDEASKSDDIEILPLTSILDNAGFPVELLAICNKTLEWNLDKHINSTLMEMKEVQKQYIRSAQIINPQLSETALKEGMHLHDVEKLEFDISNSDQIVHCPACSKQTDFKLLRFKKNYQELGPKPKYLFEVQPLLCSCGELIVMSDESIKNLDSLLSDEYQEQYIQSSNMQIDATNLYLPSARSLRSIPEIDIKNIDDTDLIENNYSSSSVSIIRNMYANYGKSFIRKDLADIFLDVNDITEPIRLKLLIDNGFMKTEFIGYTTEEIVLGTVSQMPIMLELMRIKRRLTQVNKQTLQITKVMKIIDFLLSKDLENDSLEKYNCIKFVNETLSNILSADIQLTDKDYESEHIVRSFYNRLLDLISELTISRADLESALKLGKIDIFKHPLRYFIPTKIFANKSKKCHDILNIFDEGFEVESFLTLATTFISINCWYHYLLDSYMGRFIRSSKAYKKFETEKTLKTTYNSLPAVVNSINLDNVDDLFNLELDTYKLCINELGKLNSKYRFIYRLITLTKTSTTTVTMANILNSIQEELPKQYLDKYSSLDIDKFETYFILLELGFKSDEIIEMFTLGLNRNIDCRNLAIPKNNMTLKEYVENYDNLNKYSGNRITLKQEDYNSLFKLRMLESWLEDGKKDMHTSLKSVILSYAASEVLHGVDLFSSIENIRVEHIDIKDEFNIDVCKLQLNKGKEIVKLFMDGITPVDQDLEGIYEEDNDPSIIKLVTKSGGELTELDIIKRVLDENDISMFNNIQVNSYLIFLVGHALIDSYELKDLLAIVPESKQDMFTHYYCLFYKGTYDVDWVVKNINISYTEIVDLYLDNFKQFMTELKHDLGSAYEKLRRGMKGVIGDELLNRI